MIDVIRMGVILLPLLYACYLDVKTRKVSNYFWMVLIPLGFAFNIYELLAVSDRRIYFTIQITLSVVVTYALAYLIFRLHGFGGADAKYLIALSVFFPWYPALPNLPLLGAPRYVFDLFTFTVLGNAVLITLFIFPAMFFNNLARHGKIDAAALIGYKVKVGELKSKKHYKIMERFDESGARKYKLTGVEPSGEVIAQFEGRLGKDETVWVTPKLPFIIFLTAGLLAAIFVGDMFYLMMRLVI